MRGLHAERGLSAPAAPAQTLTPALSPEYRGEGVEAPQVSVGEVVPAPRGVVEVAGERVKLRFTVTPRVGHTPGDGVVRFEVPRDGAAFSDWRVEDVTYRAVADGPSMACRLPGNVVRRDLGKTVEFDLDVAAGREGWYQLPVYVLPSNEVMVNGRPVDSLPSANRASSSATVPSTRTSAGGCRTRAS